MSAPAAHARSHARGLLAALLLALGACAGDEAPLTALVVVVDSDIPGLDSVSVDVDNFVNTGNAGEQPVVGAELADAGGERLPKRVGLVHRGGPLGPITITAEGVRDGRVEVIKRRSRVYFVRDKTMMLRLNLLNACIDNDCGGDEELTCAAIDPDSSITEVGCVSIDARASELTEWKGGIPPLVVDVGEPDAGASAIDAGIDTGVEPPECTYPAASCETLDACETNLLDDAQHCGECEHACPAVGTDNITQSACVDGACQITCDGIVYDDCDEKPETGCESHLLSNLEHCGGCGAACSVGNGVGECVAGGCTLDRCNPGWGDCNGGLDCERDITAPGPNETGGMGPCLPDVDCTRVRRGDAATGRDYYFCNTLRSYQDARDHCRSQRFGELVRIDDEAENTFVQEALGAAAWIGATDADNEGAWRWSFDTLQFWSGDGAGSAVPDTYSNWLTGEPAGANAADDCAQMLHAAPELGLWAAAECTQTAPFVCEIQADACPDDVTKQSPMQCGCGEADVHSDTDGIADCNDGCPLDADKLTPGVCGCGVAEVLDDTDTDGSPDCVDVCPLDPTKQLSAHNVCGCGNPETDTDADGLPDCADACDYDALNTVVPCAYSFTPTNFDPAGIFDGAGDVLCTLAGTPTPLEFDTSGDAPLSPVELCGTSLTPVIQAQTDGPDVWILPMNSLSIEAGVTLRFVGSRPVVLAVANDASIHGTLDVSAQNTTPTTTPGAGGNVSCGPGAGQGADGGHNSNSDRGDGGGGGGGFLTAGGNGGNGNNPGTANGGAAGTASADADLSPLRGGCRGGAVASGGNVDGAGSGGGAIELSVGGLLSLGPTAVIAAAGSGGLTGPNHEDGGGGGGSGGGILLEAKLLDLHADAWLTANGGGGAGGNATNTANGSTGGDNGNPTSTARAGGGSGGDSGNSDSDGGNGGQGAALAGPPTNGTNGTARGGCPLFCGDQGGGGGGGGGSTGIIRIQVHTPGCTAPTPRISPAATLTCP